MIKMAGEMARDTRRSAQSGVCPPVKRSDAEARRQIARPSDWADLHGLMRRKPLKVDKTSCGLAPTIRPNPLQPCRPYEWVLTLILFMADAFGLQPPTT